MVMDIMVEIRIFTKLKMYAKYAFSRNWLKPTVLTLYQRQSNRLQSNRHVIWRSRGSSPGYGGLVFLWSNFPSLMVDYYVQLGNLLLLITSPILIWYSYMILWLYRQWLNTIKFSRNMTVRIYEYLYWTRALAFGRLVRRSCSSSTQQWVGKPCVAWGIQ